MPSFLVLCLLLPLLSSCGPKELKPRAVDPATDLCPACLMTVADSGYAAEYVGHDGTILVFDDPGCLVLHKHDNPLVMGNGALFVQDAGTREWLAWDKAFFVIAMEAPSPMNYGLHAFGTEAAAAAFVAAHAPAEQVGRKSLESRMQALR